MASGSFTRQFQAARAVDECWQVLTDVDRMAGWVEILHRVVTRAPLETYEVTLEDRLGQFQLKADLNITVTEAEPPARIRFHAEGHDRQVGARLVVDAGMRIEPAAEDTLVSFDGAYSVEGRVATMGGPMIHRKADVIVEQFITRAEKELG